MWLSTFILTPIAAYLTYKATNDSSLLDTDWYIGKLKQLREKIESRIVRFLQTIKNLRHGKRDGIE